MVFYKGHLSVITWRLCHVCEVSSVIVDIFAVFVSRVTCLWRGPSIVCEHVGTTHKHNRALHRHKGPIHKHDSLLMMYSSKTGR